MKAQAVPIGEDRISQLPVHIIHHILWRTDLDPGSANQTLLLSKKWLWFWICRPNLIFQQKRTSLEEFVKLVDRSLQSHAEQNLHLEEFRLGINACEKLGSHIDRWLRSVVKFKIKVIEIKNVDRWFDGPIFRIPAEVIFSAKELTVLKLTNCKFEFDVGATNIVRFPHLETLCLRYVPMSEDQLHKVINECRFIKTLRLEGVQDIKNVHVIGLEHLEELVIEVSYLERVIVQVPNLRSLLFESCVLPTNCDIKFEGCYNTLERLTFHVNKITDKQLDDVLIKFRNISELCLFNCYNLKRIEIVSEKLKRLTLSSSGKLKRTKIKAPNLTELKFSGDVELFSSMTFLDLVQIDYPKDSSIAIYYRKSKAIHIYEDPSDFIISQRGEAEIIFGPMQRLTSIISGVFMLRCPISMSIFSSPRGKILEELHMLLRCHDNVESTQFKWQQSLKEVNVVTTKKEVATFMLKWNSYSNLGGYGLSHFFVYF